MMYINGTAVSTYGATVLEVIYGNANTNYYKDWLGQSKNYIFRDMQSLYSTSQIKLVVQGINLDVNISNMVANARHALITFDDRPFGIDGTLSNISEERINATAKEIILEIEGMKVSNGTSGATLLNGTTFVGAGNLPTGFEMVIKPASSISTMNMVLNGEVFNFKNLDAGATYTFNTSKGLFTDQNGNNCFTKFTGWELPYIIGGATNFVTLSSTPSITITYRGRWA